jgi:hypothetical protein
VLGKEEAPAALEHPEARPIRSELMDYTSLSRSFGFGDQERLLYVVYLAPYVYEDGTHDGQAIVTALFEEQTLDGSIGYAIREYSLKKGQMFYRFPKEGGHWSQAVIRQEWYRETETELPDSAFETVG